MWVHGHQARNYTSQPLWQTEIVRWLSLDEGVWPFLGWVPQRGTWVLAFCKGHASLEYLLVIRARISWFLCSNRQGFIIMDINTDYVWCCSELFHEWASVKGTITIPGFQMRRHRVTVRWVFPSAQRIVMTNCRSAWCEVQTPTTVHCCLKGNLTLINLQMISFWAFSSVA